MSLMEFVTPTDMMTVPSFFNCFASGISPPTSTVALPSVTRTRTLRMAGRSPPLMVKSCLRATLKPPVVLVFEPKNAVLLMSRIIGCICMCRVKLNRKWPSPLKVTKPEWLPSALILRRETTDFAKPVIRAQLSTLFSFLSRIDPDESSTIPRSSRHAANVRFYMRSCFSSDATQDNNHEFTVYRKDIYCIIYIGKDIHCVMYLEKDIHCVTTQNGKQS